MLTSARLLMLVEGTMYVRLSICTTMIIPFNSYTSKTHVSFHLNWLLLNHVKFHSRIQTDTHQALPMCILMQVRMHIEN